MVEDEGQGVVSDEEKPEFITPIKPGRRESQSSDEFPAGPKGDTTPPTSEGGDYSSQVSCPADVDDSDYSNSRATRSARLRNLREAEDLGSEGIDYRAVPKLDLEPERLESQPSAIDPKAPQAGSLLYQGLLADCETLFPSNQLDTILNEKLGAPRPETLTGLLAYLDVIIGVYPLPFTDPCWEACFNARRYSEQIKARSLSGDEVLKHEKLVFTLIFQLNYLKGARLEGSGNASPLPEAIIDFGKNIAKELPSEKWKLVAGYALIVLGALTALVAVATVVALMIHPATAPVAAAVALPIAKFGLEASIVACLYLLAEMVNCFKNKKKEWSALPDGMTTTRKLCAVLKPGCPTWARVKTGVAVGALVGAPSATAGAAINPVSVAVTSGFANTTVTTATTTVSVASVLTMIPLTFFTALHMIKKGRGLVDDSRQLSVLAQNVLTQKRT